MSLQNKWILCLIPLIEANKLDCRKMFDENAGYSESYLGPCFLLHVRTAFFTLFLSSSYIKDGIH